MSRIIIIAAILLAIICITAWWQSHIDRFAVETPWLCRRFNGQFSGVRKNAEGDVECLSSDGKNCMWTGDIGACNTTLSTTKSPQPLTCGKMHKAAYGTTGYDSDHWCNTMMGQIHDVAPEDI